MVAEEMGAYKYLEELWRKKQSDVLRFLLRVRLVRSCLVPIEISSNTKGLGVPPSEKDHQSSPPDSNRQSA
ncbi:MAG: hypothetical protein K2X81_22875 [Candidatus Obscuribacterales bacterium]|nr:hypothetical protein [Candidatus Obscuribacterales bacterium]